MTGVDCARLKVCGGWALTIGGGLSLIMDDRSSLAVKLPALLRFLIACGAVIPLALPKLRDSVGPSNCGRRLALLVLVGDIDRDLERATFGRGMLGKVSVEWCAGPVAKS